MKTLSRDIIVTVSVKLLLLFVLWQLCFAPFKHSKPNNQQVAKHLLSMNKDQGDDG